MPSKIPAAPNDSNSYVKFAPAATFVNNCTPFEQETIRSIVIEGHASAETLDAGVNSNHSIPLKRIKALKLEIHFLHLCLENMHFFLILAIMPDGDPSGPKPRTDLTLQRAGFIAGVARFITRWVLGGGDTPPESLAAPSIKGVDAETGASYFAAPQLQLEEDGAARLSPPQGGRTNAAPVSVAAIDLCLSYDQIVVPANSPRRLVSVTLDGRRLNVAVGAYRVADLMGMLGDRPEHYLRPRDRNQGVSAAQVTIGPASSICPGGTTSASGFDTPVVPPAAAMWLRFDPSFVDIDDGPGDGTEGVGTLGEWRADHLVGLTANANMTSLAHACDNNIQARSGTGLGTNGVGIATGRRAHHAMATLTGFAHASNNITQMRSGNDDGTDHDTIDAGISAGRRAGHINALAATATLTRSVHASNSINQMRSGNNGGTDHDTIDAGISAERRAGHIDVLAATATLTGSAHASNNSTQMRSGTDGGTDHDTTEGGISLGRRAGHIDVLAAMTTPTGSAYASNITQRRSATDRDTNGAGMEAGHRAGYVDVLAGVSTLSGSAHATDNNAQAHDSTVVCTDYDANSVGIPSGHRGDCFDVPADVAVLTAASHASDSIEWRHDNTASMKCFNQLERKEEVMAKLLDQDRLLGNEPLWTGPGGVATEYPMTSNDNSTPRDSLTRPDPTSPESLGVTVDVRALRTKLGLTQEQFANAYGFSLSTVKHWELRLRQPERPVAIFLRVIEKFPEEIRREVALLREEKAQRGSTR